ncbi:MAG: carbohydrate ABC transporter permease [Propionibacteriaceae bacterium]|jgi:raffinose/stachyose/melibiose transport system permease protein|nr:carbohydrate ABC transporter permease [Propionibacteriaceae bacterium]
MSVFSNRARPNIVGSAFAWFWLLIILAPIYYMIITSFRTMRDYFSSNPLLPSAEPTLDAYGEVFANDFARYLLNSMIVTLGSVAILLVVSVMASYVVVRNRSRVSQRLFQLILLGLAIPAQATIVPLYYMITKMGLYDSLLALVLPSVGFGIPITVLILTNFIRDIPKELFESMTVDGASHWQMLYKLVLPLAKPAIVTVGIYDALQVWNGFLFPLVLTGSPQVRVLPYSLFSFQGEHGVNTPAILASVVLSALPILAAYIVGRRQLVAGLTAGFGK